MPHSITNLLAFLAVILLITQDSIGTDDNNEQQQIEDYSLSKYIEEMGVASTYLSNEVVCDTLDIRRDSYFNLLNNCTVIEGDLLIVIINIPDTGKYRFPQLREITGSLVLYYFQGYSNLSGLFPNLAIIRGQSLSFNYALAVRDTDMRAIDLPSLRRIERGGVRIDSNPTMCHIYSINWNQIVAERDAPLRFLNIRDICPDSCPRHCPTARSFDNAKQLLCWSTKHCQSICDKKCTNKNLACHMAKPQTCCHPQCLAGCYGDGPQRCVTCRNVLHKGRCVQKCPPQYYVYMQRRCISHKQCVSKRSEQDRSLEGSQPYSIFQGKCVTRCLTDYLRNATTGFCESCAPNCPKKHCEKILIHSLKDLNEIRDCYSVKEVYISIREGGDALMSELEKAFANLRVVESNIRIRHSLSIVSLRFLKNLQLIKGKKDEMVFQVFSNEYMREIWTFDENQEKLKILQGTISFNMNRHLCQDKIMNFLKKVELPTPLSEHDIQLMKKSNGDLVECNPSRLSLFVNHISSRVAYLEWPVAKNRKNHSTMLITYKQTESNVSLYEYRAFCGPKAWKTIEMDSCKISGSRSVCPLRDLSPATRYAVYIEAKADVQSKNAISDIVYFQTKPTNPSPPRDLHIEPISSSKLRVSWTAPKSPNGVLAKYLIWYRPLPVDKDQFLMQDLCFQKDQWSRSYKSELNGKNPLHFMQKASSKEKENEMKELQNNCTCRMCSKVCSKRKDDTLSNLDAFEEHLQYNILKYKIKEATISYWMAEEDSKSLPPIMNQIDSFWLSDSRGNSLPIYRTVYSESLIMNETLSSQTSPPLDDNNWVGLIEVPATDTYFTISNLSHFSEYVVLLQACQQSENTSNSPLTANTSIELCSKYVTINEKTLPDSSKDSINSSQILVNNSHSDNVMIYWTPPARPNGVVLYYFVRYNRLLTNGQKSTGSSNCITKRAWLNKGHQLTDLLISNQSVDSLVSQFNWRSDSSIAPSIIKQLMHRIADKSVEVGGILLNGLVAGEYEFQVMLVSLAGNGSWSQTLTFQLRGVGNQKYVAWISVLLVLLLAITVGLIVGFALQHRKKKYLKQHTWVSPNPEYSSIYELDDWEMNSSDIEMLDWSHSLGKGSFGVVYKGLLKQLTTPAKHYFEHSNNMEVAVKTITKDSTMYDRREFLNEAFHMKQFQSYHLVRLLGVVNKFRQTNRGFKSKYKFLQQKWILKRLPTRLASSLKPSVNVSYSIAERYSGMPIVVMEFMSNGDLANYLRQVGDEGEGMVAKEQALLWASQIADGMLYLSTLKYVHRDLAARNCLIDHNLVVKIGDFGFARDICDNNYYRKQGGGRMPIRWMAPESIKMAYFSTKSDIWAYGVVMWEIITLASLPYRGMSHEEVMSYVVEGNTLISNGFPTKCPELLGNLMMQCWKYKDKERPTFYQILTTLNNYVDENFRKNSFFYNIDEGLKSKKMINGPVSNDHSEEGATISTGLYLELEDSNHKIDSPNVVDDCNSPKSTNSAPIQHFHFSDESNAKDNAIPPSFQKSTPNNLSESFPMTNLCVDSNLTSVKLDQQCSSSLQMRDRSSHNGISDKKHLLRESSEDPNNE